MCIPPFAEEHAMSALSLTRRMQLADEDWPSNSRGFSPAPLDPRLFDFEEVRKIRFDDQSDQALGGLSRVVPHGDLLQDADPDFPQPLTSSGLSACPSMRGTRPAKSARKGSFVSAANGSSDCSFTFRFQRGRMRMSS